MLKIGLITTNFRLVNEVAKQAKNIGVSIRFYGDTTHYHNDTRIVIVAEKNAMNNKIIKNAKILFLRDVEDVLYTLLKAVYYGKNGSSWDKLIVGIDPGHQIGFALTVDDILIYKNIFRDFSTFKYFLEYILQKFDTKDCFICIGNKDSSFIANVKNIVNSNKACATRIHLFVIDETATSAKVKDDDAALRIIYKFKEMWRFNRL